MGAMSWISVRDRLPDYNEHVLVVIEYDDGDMLVEGAYRAKDRWTYPGRDGDEVEEDGFAKVTHWMPMPEPPK